MTCSGVQRHSWIFHWECTIWPLSDLKINGLWPGDVKCRHWTLSSLAKVIAWYQSNCLLRLPHATILFANVLVTFTNHDDVIKWKHFPRYWSFVRGVHRSPLNSPHKGQSRGALMFSLIWAWINGWVNNREAGEWRLHRAHCDVTVMITWISHEQAS